MTEAEQLAANEGLVYQVAHKFRGCGMDWDDLVQEGRLGLLRAIRKFDPSKGFRFSTYAMKCIWGHLMRANRNGGIIREPAYIKERGLPGAPTVLSLDAMQYEEGEIYEQEDPDAAFEDALLLKLDLAETFPCLNANERSALYLIYAERRTLRGTGELMNLTGERVRQIQRTALMKLRAHYGVTNG